MSRPHDLPGPPRFGARPPGLAHLPEHRPERHLGVVDAVVGRGVVHRDLAEEVGQDDDDAHRGDAVVADEPGQRLAQRRVGRLHLLGHPLVGHRPILTLLRAGCPRLPQPAPAWSRDVTNELHRQVEQAAAAIVAGRAEMRRAGGDVGALHDALLGQLEVVEALEPRTAAQGSRMRNYKLNRTRYFKTEHPGWRSKVSESALKERLLST